MVDLPVPAMPLNQKTDVGPVDVSSTRSNDQASRRSSRFSRVSGVQARLDEMPAFPALKSAVAAKDNCEL